jgi:hypothetical protein
MLQRYVASKRDDEARSIIQKAVTEKVPGTDSTLLRALLTTSVSKQNESYMLSVFKAIFSVVASYPELWGVFQHDMEAAIQTARTEGKNDRLAVLLLQHGSAGYYLHKNSAEELANAAGHLCECLNIIREKVPSEDRDRLDFIKKSAIVRLSMLYLERAIQVGGEEPEADLERLRQIHEDDPAAKGPKSALASLYTFTGQKDKARDILRADMIEAFNILDDDDILNDVDGFTMLRNLLNHAGDYENALRAALLLPELQFDDTIFKELLDGEEPSLKAARAELLQFYQRECPDRNQHWKNLNKVWGEVSRLASEADIDSEMAACYLRIQKIFAKHEAGIDYGFGCSNCDRY